MFVCSSCQSQFSKWSGKCLQCDEWNTLVEVKNINLHSKKKTGMPSKTSQLSVTQKENHQAALRYTSSSVELDSVLGGGLMQGSLVLLSGEPGIGKSTLALQMSEWYSTGDNHVEVLYVSGEESIMQISGRAKRLGIGGENIEILAELDFDSILATIEASSASVVIIDSLSVLSSASFSGTSGSISHIRLMTESCMSVAKKMGKSIILIGHITKDGSISGPKSLEHLVDVVLFLEGVRTENYRILRTLKNRFGSSDAVGIFRMEETGLQDLSDPGMEFIDEKNFELSGSALTLTVEGNRPILIEIEALTTYTKFGYPKRSVRGIHPGKLDLLLAVLGKYTQVKLDNSDVYVNISRGLKLSEPGGDLACIAAVMSSKKNTPSGKRVYFGEVSLTGIVKNVFLLEKRLQEAVKLGFTEVYIPAIYQGKIPKGLQVIRIGNISELQIK